MDIDNLIAALQRVREAKGNIEVVFGSFAGTNNGFTLFHAKPIEEGFDVADKLNGHGQFSISIELSPSTIADIKKGVEDMQKQGYTYYRSQFVGAGERPRSGMSPCDWHIPW